MKTCLTRWEPLVSQEELCSMKSVTHFLRQKLLSLSKIWKCFRIKNIILKKTRLYVIGNENQGVNSQSHHSFRILYGLNVNGPLTREKSFVFAHPLCIKRNKLEFLNAPSLESLNYTDLHCMSCCCTIWLRLLQKLIKASEFSHA
jgi:hypothetical protein